MVICLQFILALCSFFNFLNSNYNILSQDATRISLKLLAWVLFLESMKLFSKITTELRFYKLVTSVFSFYSYAKNAYYLFSSKHLIAYSHKHVFLLHLASLTAVLYIPFYFANILHTQNH